VEKNHKYCEETIQLTWKIEGWFFEIGERLARIRDEELYKPGWESFPLFLEEMRMSESNASKLINIHQKLVVQFQIPKPKLLALGGMSDLADILPLATSKEAALALIDEMSPLMRSDRRLLLREKKTGNPAADCKHRDTYKIEVCRDCGQRIRDYG